jgi:transglutaminase-like putative cysteine protease
MKIRVGYELLYDCSQPTPMILTLSVHETRIPDIVSGDVLVTDPPVPVRTYRDIFGNICRRIIAPAGLIRMTSTAIMKDRGEPDTVALGAVQHPVEDLPEDTLLYLLGSRYCETDHLSQDAWNLFDQVPAGWARVQAICDFVHKHIVFGYEHARATKTAWEVYRERQGVCRDYAHLAIAFCRCMNIPARYCSGYLGNIGMPLPHCMPDFAGWFEAYLGDRWYTFDPRNNTPRIGRVLIARGRDAADVAITNTFGLNTLIGFMVTTEEIPELALVAV